MNLTKTELDALLRTQLGAFIHKAFNTLVPGQSYHHNWHIAALAWHLEQAAAGNITRLLITLPPRSLKSVCASVAFPAWLLGRDPSRRIVGASYSAELAGKHAGDCRQIMESAWYRRIFLATRIARGRNSEMDFVTTRQGYRYSTSVGGTLTGRGGDMLIIDDPLKADDAMSQAKRDAVNEWYDGTLYSRLDDKRRGVIILIMQRLHLDDLAGHVLEQEQWTHLNLPAIAETDQTIRLSDQLNYYRPAGELLHPELEPQDVLDRMKRTLGSFKFSGQYQQNPILVEGNLVKTGWFRYYDQVPSREQTDQIVQSWDTAYADTESSDYSVCSTWLVRRQEYFLLDILRQRLTYAALREVVKVHAIRWHSHVVVIENRSSGMALIDDLRQATDYCGPPPIAFDPVGDKIDRMARHAAAIEAGQVVLPRQASFLGDFLAELAQFPHGGHDDQVDSLSQFLDWMQSRRSTFTWDFGWSGSQGLELPGIIAPHSAPPPPTVIAPRVFIPHRGQLIPQDEYLARFGPRTSGE